MLFVVQSIDFGNRALAVQVNGAISHDHARHLRNFIGYCAYLGFAKVALEHPADIGQSSLEKLEQLLDAPHAVEISIVPLAVSASSAAPRQRHSKHEECGFALVGRGTDSGGPVEYEFSCRDLTAVFDCLTTAVLIVGYSVPLDEDSLSRLRLCLYELAANTVEHAIFDGAEPEIRVSLVVGDECIIAKYSDNALAFSTLCGRRIDVGERITRGARRGLGLFLLNNITEGLSYARDDTWNHTRFIIHREKDAAHNLNRRKDMNELTVTITPTDSQDTVVVTPAGSINSSTVPHLDAELNRLMQAGKSLIVIDFSQTEFISSSGVGLLIGTVSVLRDKGGDMVLMKLPKLVNDIFEVLNIKMHFRVIKGLSELRAGART